MPRKDKWDLIEPSPAQWLTYLRGRLQDGATGWTREQLHYLIGRYEVKQRMQGAKNKEAEPGRSNAGWLTVYNPFIRKAVRKLGTISSFSETVLTTWDKATKGPWPMRVLGIVSSVGYFINYFVDLVESPQEYLKAEGYDVLCVAGEIVEKPLLALPRHKTLPEGFFVPATNATVAFCHVPTEKGELPIAFIITGEKLHGPSSGCIFYDQKWKQEEVRDIIGAVVREHYNSSFIILSTVINPQGESEFGVIPVEITPGEFVGKNTEEDLLRVWRLNMENGMNRSMLFYGPTGTGKTTLAQRLALLHGGSILQVDGSLVEKPELLWGAVGLFKPSVLLLDDIDRIDGHSHLLSFLEAMGNRPRDFLLVTTANDITNLDRAALRPGRIDMAVEFTLPNEEECRAIVDFYWDKRPSPVDPNTISSMLRGLPPAFIKEAVEQASIQSMHIGQLESYVGQMRKVYEETDYTGPSSSSTRLKRR